MKKISIEEIDKVWDEINSLSETDMDQLIEVMSEEQPFIMSYLLDNGAEEFTDNEHEVVFYIGFSIWHILKRNNYPVTEVLQTTIERIEKQNVALVEKLDEQTVETFDEMVEQVINIHPQPDLIQFVGECILAESFDEEDKQIISDENAELMFLLLKTVVDCFTVDNK